MCIALKEFMNSEKQMQNKTTYDRLSVALKNSEIVERKQRVMS
jgi:hypothetical protein